MSLIFLKIKIDALKIVLNKPTLNYKDIEFLIDLIKE
jgi:hypothetical protein